MAELAENESDLVTEQSRGVIQTLSERIDGANCGGEVGGEARSRRPNMARYLWKRGSLVSSSVFSRSGIEGSLASRGIGGAGSIEVKSLETEEGD